MTTIAVANKAMPAVGLGLWKIEREATARTVQDAISIGYRHIDSACDYGNEAEAGEGLDLDVYWRSILHHDEEAPGCTHQETRPEGIELFTFGAYAHLPREGRSLARTLARVDGGLRYGCETPAVESRWRFT